MWSLFIRMLGRRIWLKTAVLLVFFLWLLKSDKLIKSSLVDHHEKCGF